MKKIKNNFNYTRDPPIDAMGIRFYAAITETTESIFQSRPDYIPWKKKKKKTTLHP